MSASIKTRLASNDSSIFEDHIVYFEKSTYATVRLNKCVNCSFFFVCFFLPTHISRTPYKYMFRTFMMARVRFGWSVVAP